MRGEVEMGVLSDGDIPGTGSQNINTNSAHQHVLNNTKSRPCNMQ